MSKEEIVEKLIGFFKIAFRYEGDDLTADTKINDTFGVNSMKRIAVCALIEDELEVTVSAAKFATYETIGDLADYVQSEYEE